MDANSSGAHVVAMGLFNWLWGGRDVYLSYEKSFERIVDKTSAILARRHARRKKMETYSRSLWHAFSASVVAGIGHLIWLNRLPAGSMPWQQHLTRSALSIIVPIATFAMYIVFGKLVSIFESRDDRTLKRLYNSKKKMVQDLKDSTRFEKTLALIQRYSPEDIVHFAPPVRQAPVPITPSTKQQAQLQARPNATPHSQLLSAAAGAGKALLPMFDSLATNIMGDNPQLVAHLREAQAQLAAERQRNAALVQQINELQAKYGISAADMSATRHLSRPPEAHSPLQELAFNVQAAEDEEGASPSFLTGPFIQPRTLTYSGGEGTPESRLHLNGRAREEFGVGHVDGGGAEAPGEEAGPPGGEGGHRAAQRDQAGRKGDCEPDSQPAVRSSRNSTSKKEAGTSAGAAATPDGAGGMDAGRGAKGVVAERRKATK